MLFALVSFPAAAQTPVHHRITAIITPDDHRIEVVDVVDLPHGSAAPPRFSLHAGLTVHEVRGAELTPVDSDPETATPGSAAVRNYRIVPDDGVERIELVYSGEIFHALQQQPDEMRVTETSAGIISDDGVLLDGAAAWYPRFDRELVTFRLELQLPPGWTGVSQGARRAHADADEGHRVVWEENRPQDDIYIVAARFHEYAEQAGDVTAQVFLRDADADLARRYLDATIDYLAMYSTLLGPYPYDKFALVENFWQTGYGMPSFTLMGSRIIRFPFILHSSYPHEILHNWWGNGVYVDYSAGNWSEGLTAYLADHLLTEQRGDAVECRRSALQKYSDYVADNSDFPLDRFTGRHSAASEAVGYGKTMMFFHMLRQRAGDEAFLEAMRRFYADHRFRRATFDDIRRAFERVKGWDYGWMFEQWVQRPGAPELRLTAATATPAGGGYRLDLELEQRQGGEPYRLDVPVAVTLEGVEQAYQTVLRMTDRELSATLPFGERPLRVDIDPEFDLFRRLAPDERPPSLSQIFGSDKVTLVLPAGAPPAMRRHYMALAGNWPVDRGAERIVTRDDRIERLPDSGAVVLLGSENRFHRRVIESIGARVDVDERNVYANDDRLSAYQIRIADDTYPLNERSFALMTTRPETGVAVLWLGADTPEAMPGLVRKLPHYAKYSYVLFEGEEPTNIGRGVWPVSDSSLTAVLTQTMTDGVRTRTGDDEAASGVTRARLEPRRALTAAVTR